MFIATPEEIAARQPLHCHGTSRHPHLHIRTAHCSSCILGDGSISIRKPSNHPRPEALEVKARVPLIQAKLRKALAKDHMKKRHLIAVECKHSRDILGTKEARFITACVCAMILRRRKLSGLILGLTKGISHVHPLITRLQYSLLDPSNVEPAG